jgi:hypothetical protein
MLNAQQVGMLLLKASTFDNRRVTPEMIQSWTEALKPYVGLEDAKRAVIEYYGDPKWEDSSRPAWLLPGNVNKRVQRMRTERVDRLLASAEQQVTGPNVWEATRQLRSAIADGVPVASAVAQAQSTAALPVLESKPNKVFVPEISARERAFKNVFRNIPKEVTGGE